MTGERQRREHLLPTLIGGFVLLVFLLVASAYIGIGAMQSAEHDAAQLRDEQRAAMQLIDDIQREEDSLSSVFYSLAAGTGDTSRRELFDRLNALQTAIQRTTAAGLASGAESAVWRRVRDAADAFIAEGRITLETGLRPPPAFFRKHEQLVSAVADLASANLESSAAKARAESVRSQSRVRYSLLLLGLAVALACVGAVYTIYAVNDIFRRLRWQASELAHLSSRSMSDQEANARRFSRELHDQFGQTLNAIEANLVAMRHAGQYNATRMEDCLALIKDAIDNVREVSQLLRPSILDDFGLDASLRWLAESFSERSAIAVEYESSFSARLADETETQLFRIAQEALTNVARHSNATRVRIELASAGRSLTLKIADNGDGFSPQNAHHGLGLIGMRARARAAHGSVTIESSRGNGVIISVELPLDRTRYAPEDSHLVGR